MTMQEAGKAVASITEGLKGNPLALALVVINLLFLGIVFYVLHEVAEGTQRNTANNAALLKEILGACFEKKG